MKRNLKLILILFIIFGTPLRLNALVQIAVSGYWSVTIDSADDFPTCTSAQDEVTIDIDASNKEKWLVSVSKSDTNWDPSLQLYIRRTSDGVGSGKISGGTTFQEITSTNQTFIDGQKTLSSISVQFQLTGLSYQISPDAYASTVYYTITDN